MCRTQSGRVFWQVMEVLAHSFFKHLHTRADPKVLWKLSHATEITSIASVRNAFILFPSFMTHSSGLTTFLPPPFYPQNNSVRYIRLSVFNWLRVTWKTSMGRFEPEALIFWTDTQTTALLWQALWPSLPWAPLSWGGGNFEKIHFGKSHTCGRMWDAKDASWQLIYGNVFVRYW